MAAATKVDEDARRKYESYVGLQKEVKNLVNDTRRKITTDGMKQQAFEAQKPQHLHAVANMRFQQENA